MVTMNKEGATQFATPSDREVVITRVVGAPRRLIFDAYTKPEHAQRWMFPEGWSMPVCEIDLRPGGSQRMVWRRPSGTEMEICGVYREIAPPERLVWSESWGGDWPETINTLHFSEEGGKTTITMTLLYPSKEARDAALRTGMKDGAIQGFDSLEEYVRTMA